MPSGPARCGWGSGRTPSSRLSVAMRSPGTPATPAPRPIPPPRRPPTRWASTTCWATWPSGSRARTRAGRPSCAAGRGTIRRPAWGRPSEPGRRPTGTRRTPNSRRAAGGWRMHRSSASASSANPDREELGAMRRKSQQARDVTRREFVHASAAAAAALALPGARAPVGRADTLRIGLVGCGGRGTGAAKDCLTSSERVELVAIGAGTQRRHDAGYRAAMQRIHDGAIGDIVSAQVYWNQGGLWMKPRQPQWSDVEWQIRNWLYFTWLSGDHIVEQHIHNIDVANWALGAHPVKAVGVGGRQWRTDPAYGHIYDHFAIDFEYPNGAHVLSMCRQIDGTASHVAERIVGTRGTSDAHSVIEGAAPWSWDAQTPRTNPYVQEHADLIASIRPA